MIDAHERPYLERCLALAEQALTAGDEPFGSVLVDGEGRVRAEDRNRIAEGAGDATRHPEFALARWAAEHMSAAERTAAWRAAYIDSRAAAAIEAGAWRAHAA